MLTALDHLIFTKINYGMSSAFLDRWMPVITDFHQTPVFLGLLLPLMIGYVVATYKVRGVFFVLATVCVVGVSDLVTYRLVKQNVQRERPEKTDLRPILRVPSHSGHSFPSNHAANVFALAVFAGNLMFRLGTVLCVFAFVVALSRVYVGVHFPSDVFGGALIGSLVAMVSWHVYAFIEDRVDQWILEKEEAESDARREGSGIVYDGGVKRVWANSKGVVTGEVKETDFVGKSGRKKKREEAIILESNDRAAPTEIAIGDLGGLEESEKIKK